MEDVTLHITAADLMNCFRTNRRQGFITGVCFMITLRLVLRFRDVANANAAKTGEVIGGTLLN